MSQTQARKKRNWLWIAVAVVLLVVWFIYRPAPDTGSIGAAAWELGDPDDILLDLRDDLSSQEVDRLANQYGLVLTLVSDQSEDERFYKAHVDPAQRDALLIRLGQDERVQFAEPDALVQLIPQFAPEVLEEAKRGNYPNDPMYKHQWHLDQINMPKTWPITKGDGVIVAVIDTGVAFENYKSFHRVADLRADQFVPGYDFVGNDPHANDDHGHGTHVAGTIAQATNNSVGVAGVAPSAKIMPLKVLSKSGSGSIGAIADAVRFAADQGAHVINMSLGGPFPSRILADAVQYAHDKGVVVVCAAGNDGRGRVSYPAKYPGAFAVAATQYDESTTFYSNWGAEIDIAAPGGNTRVDQNGDGMPDGVLQNTIVVGNPKESGYFPFMGTSMASPHVAGVAALVFAAGITDAKQVEATLQESARQPVKSSLEITKKTPQKHRYGAGIVDAHAAVMAAQDKNAGSAAVALLIALAVAGGSAMRKRASFWIATTFGSAGLFFLPYLGFECLALTPLTTGLPSWDVLGHGNPLLFSAFIPVAFLLLGYGHRRLQGAIVGLLCGVAGSLLFHAAAGTTEINWMPFDALWLTLNGLLCLVAARLALRR